MCSSSIVEHGEQGEGKNIRAQEIPMLQHREGMMESPMMKHREKTWLMALCVLSGSIGCVFR